MCCVIYCVHIFDLESQKSVQGSVYWLCVYWETGWFFNPSFHPQPDVNDNKIPEMERPVQPTINEVEIVQNNNEIPLVLDNKAKLGEEQPSNVLMSHASEDSIFNKTEVLAGQWECWTGFTGRLLKSIDFQTAESKRREKKVHND